MDFINAFPFLADNWHFVFAVKLPQHLKLSFIPIVISIVFGVGLGVGLGHIHRFSFLAINTSNIGRALPSLGVLAICLPFTGVGPTAVYIAMVVLGLPPILTNAYVAIEQVEADVVDAANGVGLRPWQVLLRVEMPLALPLIFAGVRTSSVFVIATATLGGFFASGGMGEIIVNRESYGLDGVIGASYVLVALAFIVQGLLILLERTVTPRGLRPDRQAASGEGANEDAPSSVVDDALVSAGTNIG